MFHSKLHVHTNGKELTMILYYNIQHIIIILTFSISQRY